MSSALPPRTRSTSIESALSWAALWRDHVREATDQAAAELAVFLDPEEVLEEGIAELALTRVLDWEAPSPKPPSPEELRRAAQSAVHSLLLRNRELHTREIEPGSHLRDHEEALVGGLGISHDRVREALKSYNSLAEDDRQAFFEIFIRKTPYSNLVASFEAGSRWSSLDAFRASMQRSLAALYTRGSELA